MNEHETPAPDSQAVAGLVERTVRPCAWTAHSWLASRNGGHFVPERRHAFDVPLYDQAALDAAVQAEHDRWIAKAGRVYTDAHAIFNDPPSETPQDVRDVIEWHLASLRA